MARHPARVKAAAPGRRDELARAAPVRGLRRLCPPPTRISSCSSPTLPMPPSRRSRTGAAECPACSTSTLVAGLADLDPPGVSGVEEEDDPSRDPLAPGRDGHHRRCRGRVPGHRVRRDGGHGGRAGRWSSGRRRHAASAAPRRHHRRARVPWRDNRPARSTRAPVASRATTRCWPSTARTASPRPRCAGTPG